MFSGDLESFFFFGWSVILGCSTGVREETLTSENGGNTGPLMCKRWAAMLRFNHKRAHLARSLEHSPRFNLSANLLQTTLCVLLLQHASWRLLLYAQEKKKNPTLISLSRVCVGSRTQETNGCFPPKTWRGGSLQPPPLQHHAWAVYCRADKPFVIPTKLTPRDPSHLR